MSTQVEQTDDLAQRARAYAHHVSKDEFTFTLAALKKLFEVEHQAYVNCELEAVKQGLEDIIQQLTDPINRAVVALEKGYRLLAKIGERQR